MVPLSDVELAFDLLKENRPSDNEIDANITRFINYYQTTWLSLFPLSLWNHYDTIGPRTNNHVEGENAALNRFVNVESPDIYSLILCLKDIESLVAIKYLKNELNNEPQKRRPIDVQRDQVITLYKAEYSNKTLQLYTYLTKISQLFSFTDAKQTSSVLQAQAPKLTIYETKLAELKDMQMDLYDRLQKTDFTGAQYHFGLRKPNVKPMLDHLINQYRKIISNFEFDQKVHQVVSKYKNFLDDNCGNYYEPVLTTADGNCFYNAISIVLYGNEKQSKLLRLANVYVLSVFDSYFRNVCIKTCTNYTYEHLIKITAKDRTWANETNILAMTIVLDRPIALWSKNLHHKTVYTLIFCTPHQYNKQYIHLILQDSHFTALLSKDVNYKFPILPNFSAFQNFLLMSLI